MTNAAIDSGDATLDAASTDGHDATLGNDGVTPDADFADASPPNESDASDAPEEASDGDIDANDAESGGFPCMPNRPPSTLVLFGGEGMGVAFSDTWLWDGTAWSEVDAGRADGPPTREAAAMATACGYAVLVDGTGDFPDDGGSPVKGDAWLWNGARWLPAPAAPATPRFLGAAATLGATLYLFGGQTGGRVNPTEADLLAWAGGAWYTPPQSSPSGPSARFSPVLVNVDGGLLLFGGEDNLDDVFPDTWLLTDSSWQLLDDGGSGSGPALQGAGAASVGDTVVLFGGEDGNCVPQGDTWLWNGRTWSRVPAQDGGPQARANPMMGSLNGQVVLFGGSDDAGVLLGDTWLWDGGAWVRGPEAGPPPRTLAAMTAY